MPENSRTLGDGLNFPKERVLARGFWIFFGLLLDGVPHSLGLYQGVRGLVNS